MGKKRQRNAAKNGENEKPTPQQTTQLSRAPAEPVMKKPKKAPLQLKMIVMKGATTETKKVESTPVPVVEKAPVMSTADGESSKKGKKKKKKNKTQASDSTNVEKPNTAKKTDTADIDDLFKTLKTKKQESALAAEREAAEEAKAKKKARKERERLDEQIKLLEAQNTNLTAVQGKNPDPRPLRYDEDGLPIYSEESLQINQGGDTADCPFDCWCCF